MIKIDRYIRTSVINAMLLVLVVLVGLDLIFSVFEELGDTNERYGAGHALLYVLMTLPRHVYELLPMTALIGALLGLGILASNNELVALQAAGVKVGRIVWSVMKPTLAVMLFGLCLGEYIAPPLELKGEVDKAIVNGEQVALSRYGHWQREGREFMHFNAIEPNGILHGVTIYAFDEGRQLIGNTVAERAIYQSVDGRNYWLLEEVRETLFRYRGEDQGSLNTHYPNKIWDVDLSPELLRVLIVDSDKMALSDLYSYARRFQAQGLDAGPYFLAFWKKVMQPLTTAVLVLAAISFIFGPLRNVTMGFRLFVAIGFGLLFIIVQRLLSTLSLVYQFDPFMAVLLPIMLIAGLGVFLLKRAV